MRSVDWTPGILLSIRGKLLFRAGRFDEAIPDLEQVLSTPLGKTDSETMFVLAMAYHQRCRREDAEKMFNRGREFLERKAPEGWYYRTIYEFVRKEAAAVLGM